MCLGYLDGLQVFYILYAHTNILPSQKWPHLVDYKLMPALIMSYLSCRLVVDFNMLSTLA